jgi:ribosomal protein S18 acetylase RimI-like enzyme
MNPDLVWSDTLDDVNWDELSAVYLAAPLGIKSGAHLRTVFTASRFRCFVREGGRLVGAGRVLSDGADCAYVCDIALLPSHQGSGLGSRIVEHLVALSKGHRKIILYAVPGREGFYARFGFRRMKTAMAIFADQADAVRRGYVEPIDGE